MTKVVIYHKGWLWLIKSRLVIKAVGAEFKLNQVVHTVQRNIL